MAIHSIGERVRMPNKMRRLSGSFLVAVIGTAGTFLAPLHCAAQVPVVRSGSFEIGGFAGTSYGVDAFRVMVGGNVTYAANKWLLPYVEYSYFPGIARSISQPLPGLPGVTAQSTFSAPLSDFHGGIHVRIPIRESPVVPYLVFGLGGLTHFSRTTTLTYTGADGLAHNIPGTDPGGTDFAVNFGGGLRYYINQRFGFRVEAKGYKANSSLTAAFGKVEAGFFYQLR
jgi:outer membrane protein with beta-barrel domain